MRVKNDTHDETGNNDTIGDALDQRAGRPESGTGDVSGED